MKVEAILYDLDGVLVDACEIHYEAFNKALMQVCGFKLSRREHESEFNGLTTKTKITMLRDRGRIPSELFESINNIKQNYTRESLDLLKIDPIKVKLHSKVKEMGLKLGCVTNSIRVSAEKMLVNTGQYNFMDVLVSNEDIVHPKPCSEGYIEAMVVLGVVPRNVLIVEDSPKGLTAARATGAHVLQVNNASEVTWDHIQGKLKC